MTTEMTEVKRKTEDDTENPARKLATDVEEKAPGPTRSCSSSGFFSSSSSSKNFSKIRDLLLSCLMEEDLDKFRRNFNSQNFTPRESGHFFIQEGDGLLSWCLNDAMQPGSLQCLMDLFGEKNLRQMLSQNDCSALKYFLIGLAAIEREGLYGAEEEDNQIKKFKILFQVLDKEGIDFMKENVQSDKIKASLTEALKQHSADTGARNSVLSLT